MPAVAEIRSLHHPAAAAIIACRRPAERRAAGVCIAEGPHLVGEALAAGLRPRLAVLRQGEGGDWGALLQRLRAELEAPAGGDAAAGLWSAPGRVFAALSGVLAPQGLLAIFQLPPAAQADAPPPVCTLALDGVQDPGNVGTLARALLAFAGAGALLLSGGRTADPFGEKALRASAGAAFHLAHRFAPDLAAAVAESAGLGVRWWALVPRGGQTPRAADLAPPVGLVVGSEGQGVSAPLRAACALLSVPMPGPAESLNAALAGGIVLYEAGTRRMGGQRLT